MHTGKNRTRYLFWIGLLALLISLAACGGSPSTAASSSTSQASQTKTPSSGSNSLANAQSTLSFTISGDFTGTYTFAPSGSIGDLQPETPGTDKALHITVYNQSLNFAIDFFEYTGPGSYTLAGNNAQVTQVNLANEATHKDYQLLSASSSCSLIVSSDTPFTEDGSTSDRIKGSISCPSLTENPDGGPAVSLSNGQFDGNFDANS
jgi:hypothetical protein